jgi:hypothetical protein
VKHITGIGERTLNPIAAAAISSLPVVVEARVLTRKSNFAAEEQPPLHRRNIDIPRLII